MAQSVVRRDATKMVAIGLGADIGRILARDDLPATHFGHRPLGRYNLKCVAIEAACL
jgi:hypothetical protein